MLVAEIVGRQLNCPMGYVECHFCRLFRDWVQVLHRYTPVVLVQHVDVCDIMHFVWNLAHLHFMERKSSYSTDGHFAHAALDSQCWSVFLFLERTIS